MNLGTLPQVDPRQAFQFLKTGYELMRTGHLGCLNVLEVGRALGFSDKTSHDICAYLADRGFIDQVTPDYEFHISDKGVDEIEWALTNPGYLQNPAAT